MLFIQQAFNEHLLCTLTWPRGLLPLIRYAHEYPKSTKKQSAQALHATSFTLIVLLPKRWRKRRISGSVYIVLNLLPHEYWCWNDLIFNYAFLFNTVHLSWFFKIHSLKQKKTPFLLKHLLECRSSSVILRPSDYMFISNRNRNINNLLLSKWPKPSWNWSLGFCKAS